MKKFIYTAIIALSTTFAIAQNKAEWKELKDFHTVMSQTFHPAEEGNLKPIRERSAEMVKAAEAWKKSAIPADYKNVKDIQETLSRYPYAANDFSDEHSKLALSGYLQY